MLPLTKKSENEHHKPFTVKVLGINDFHGQVLSMDGKGGMYALSEALMKEIKTTNEFSFVLHAGDHVGASPAESALLQDEPAIEFLNEMQRYCHSATIKKCEVIGTAGNHEFDEGSEEMMRLLTGGNHADGPFIFDPWQGAEYMTLSANVIDKRTHALLLPPYVVHEVNQVPIGFIGITLDTTPALVIPGIVDDLIFQDQANAVKKYSNVLQKRGVEAIVLIVHDGSSDTYYAGNTQVTEHIPTDSNFARFLSAIPDSIDLVISGHSHQFTNAFFPKKSGKQILVTQAFSKGLAYADITLTIDPKANDIVKSSAKIINNLAENQAQVSKDASLRRIQSLIDASSNYAKTIADKVIGEYLPQPEQPELGRFIADAHRFSLKTDLGIMNPGGVRAELHPGKITWGSLFAVQPFSNELVIRRYDAATLKRLLHSGQHFSNNVSKGKNGDFLLNGKRIDPTLRYTIGGNSYIMNQSPFTEGEKISQRGSDLDETIKYIKLLPQPFSYLDKPNEN